MDLTCNEEMMCDTPLLDETLKAPYEDDILDFPPEENQRAIADMALIKDPRVLQNMLKVEERLNGHSFSYFKMLQTDITPEMRHSVTKWMFEVCEEEGLPDNTFLLSVNYMDRFLTVTKIEKSQFQLLATVCLLIASKWVGPLMSLEKLILYTASSIDKDMLLNWEMMVLAQFKWNVFSLTPHDFVEFLLYRLPENLWHATNVREKVKTYVSYCSTDYSFRIHLPSMIASASIAAAIGNQVSRDVLQEVLHCLHVITNIETDVLRATMDQIRLAVQLETMAGMENRKAPGDNHPGMSTDSMDHSEFDKLGELGQAETPTDVGDIDF